MTFGLECLVMISLVLFLDESFYRRDISQSEQPNRGSRMLRLIGIWQVRAHRGYFSTFGSSVARLFGILLKPIIVPLFVF